MKRLSVAVLCVLGLYVVPLLAALPAIDAFTGTGALSGSWTVVAGTVARVSDRAEGTTGSAYNLAKWNADSFNADQYAEAELSEVSGGYPQICVRVTATSSSDFDGYCAYLVAGGATIKLSRVDNGTGTDLGAAFGDRGIATTIIRVSVTGTTLTLLYDGVSQGTRTDATYSSGVAAIFPYGLSRIDSFRADNVGGGGGPTCRGGLSLLGVGGC